MEVESNAASVLVYMQDFFKALAMIGNVHLDATRTSIEVDSENILWRNFVCASSMARVSYFKV